MRYGATVVAEGSLVQTRGSDSRSSIRPREVPGSIILRPAPRNQGSGSRADNRFSAVVFPTI